MGVMVILRCAVYLSLVVIVIPQRIGEGVEVHDPKKFPFFAMLTIFYPYNSTWNTGYGCGGSLIHPQWILTAGHCVPNDTSLYNWIANSDMYMVFMGSVLVPQIPHFRQSRKIRGIHRHPDYILREDNEGLLVELQNDIALLKVHKPFHLSKTVQLIPLAFQKCKYVIAIGIGQTQIPKGSPESNILKYAKLIPDFRERPPPHHNTFRAGNKVGNIDFEAAGYALQGDSGGPVICDNVFPPVQIGLVSNGGPVDIPGNQVVINILEKPYSYIDSFISHYVPNVKNPDKFLNHTGKKRRESVSNSESLTIDLWSVLFIANTYVVF